MRLVRKQLETEGSNNQPLLKGKPAERGDYYEAFIRGFRQFYRLLVKYRANLLVGPLALFTQDEIRVIMRPTHSYFRLLQESRHPDLMRSISDYKRFFDGLWQTSEQHPELNPLVLCEQKDLFRGDIPIFTTRVNSLEIYSSEAQPLVDLLTASGWDASLGRLQGLGQVDFALQLSFIKEAFAGLARTKTYSHSDADSNTNEAKLFGESY
jgi:lantibiotic modifying enzyme